MKFSIEEILKKDDKPRGNRDSAGNWSRSDSDSSMSYTPRSLTPDSTNADSAMSDCSDDAFIDTKDSPTKKRIRTVIVRTQKQKLELFFQRSQYQSRLDLTKISRELGLPQHALKIWFQNRRAKYRKQCHKITTPSETESMLSNSSRSSASSPNLPEPIEQNSDDFHLALRRDSAVSCTLPCCAPKAPHVNKTPYCNCISCEKERILIFQNSIRKRLSGRQSLESLQKYLPFQNMEQVCSRRTFCCCAACRQGTFYVKY